MINTEVDLLVIYIFRIRLMHGTFNMLKNVITCTRKQILFFYVLLAVHLSIILDNDQLDTHLLYFTIRLL